MSKSKISKSTEGEEPKQRVDSGQKELNNFLYPKMPGMFLPYAIRKMPIEKLRDRYLRAFSASMGNHSLSKFYCCWSEEQYEAALSPAFEKRISDAMAILADRATYIMYRGMGLVADDPDKATLPTITAAIAKVVETMNGPSNKGGVSGKMGKAYRLTVNGLARPAPPTGKP